MQRHAWHPLVPILILLLVVCQACSPGERAAAPDGPSGTESVSLLESMSWMQTYTHKLVLSVDAQNKQLVDFYLHEIEELAEDVAAGVPEYDGFPVGDLVEAMLITEIERLEEIAARGNWDEIRTGVVNLVAACNSCHVATDHGYIRILDRADLNPFMQDFGVTDAGAASRP